MAYSATNYLEQKFLNTMRGTTFTAPSKVYIGLYTSNPTDTGTHSSEVNYAGYSRQQITFSEPIKASGETDISIRNSTEITFPELLPTATSVTISYIGISDNITRASGNMLIYGELEESLTITGEEEPVFLAGDIRFYPKGDLSEIYKKKFANTLRGISIAAFTPYLALFNGNPENGGTELGGSGSNYSRKSATFNSIVTNGDKSQIENSSLITFNRANDWANKTLTYRTIFDAITGGNAVWYKSEKTKVVSRGRQIRFKTGTVKIGVD